MQAANRAPCLPVKSIDRGSVVVSRRRLHTPGARAPFDKVQIQLQDPILGKKEFGDRHQSQLETLSDG